MDQVALLVEKNKVIHSYKLGVIMEIKIKLNDMKYRYEVFQIANLFFSFKDIKFIEEEYDFKIDVKNHIIVICSSNNKNLKEYYIEDENSIKEQIKKCFYLYLSETTGTTHPWGTLLGIRPSKIALNLIEKGFTEEYITDYFKTRFLTSSEKAKLCIDVARYEKAFVNNEKHNISLYIGMPFCPTRCLYCSFASNPIKANKKLVEPYLNALKKEIEELSKYIKVKDINVENIYFGGGTPTAIEDEDFKALMEVINENFAKHSNFKEFTVECGRPDSITEGKLLAMKEAGVTRISINPQTMNEDTLLSIGRMHKVQEVVEKFNLARALGFDNINMDIIVGLPGENTSYVENTCSEISALKPDSLTVHGLSIKRASRLYEDICLEKKYSMPNQIVLNSMYEKTKELAKELDMVPYYMYRQKNMVGNMENVGYSKAGKECIYNIQIIEEKQTIIALGADAISKVVFLEENRIERYANVKDVREYINRIDEMIYKKIQLLNTLY